MEKVERGQPLPTGKRIDSGRVGIQSAVQLLTLTHTGSPLSLETKLGGAAPSWRSKVLVYIPNIGGRRVSP
jgi:hypothetical protein